MNYRYALVSVFNKNKLDFLCKNLSNNNYSLIATETTCSYIRKLGYKCISTSKITKYKNLLDGRVKTISPEIFSSILHERENTNHIKQIERLHIPKIDIVIVNLYPFKKFVDSNNEKKITDMIDIGGCSLLRASSKNYKDVTIISQINDYSKLVKNLIKNKGVTDISFRKYMATKAFEETYKYDQNIFRWLNKTKLKNKKISLRYGENPNQKSYLETEGTNSILKYKISGKNLSYNNIMDVDSGIKCLNEFDEPTCIIIKHTNPCGVASSKLIETAFRNALQCDVTSAFGGVILINRKMSVDLAKQISNSFFEIVVATSYDQLCLDILAKRKNLILLKIKKLNMKKREFKSTIFGTVYQDNSSIKINKRFLRTVSKKNTSSKLVEDIIFSLKVVKHLNSNAIVLSYNKQTLGIGSGFTSRIEAIKTALEKVRLNFKNKKFVCASDGFFPFTDSLKILKKNRCNVVAQPSGSINDNEIINFANKNNISLFFTKNRLFKH